jgi:hypothetical protein
MAHGGLITKKAAPQVRVHPALAARASAPRIVSQWWRQMEQGLGIKLFLSTVSAEFKSYREALRHDFERPNVTVKVQEDFIVSGTPTLDMLDTYIQQCDGVIHLVGDMTGAMAKPKSVEVIRARYADQLKELPIGEFLRPGGPSLSYTQWEAWLAVLHKKKLFIAIPAEQAPRDPRYVLDLAQKAAQQEHLERLKQEELYPGEPFTSLDHLSKLVLGRSFIFDLLTVSSRVQQRPVPELLPYLPNRDGQEMQIVTAMQELLVKQGQRTLVTIVHGNEDESHETFLPRLLNYNLTGRLRSAESIRQFQVPWPKHITPSDDFKRHFREWLQQKVLQESTPSADGLAAFFQQQPGPIILSSTLYTDDWGDQGLSILEALRTFWNDPDNLPDCRLIHWITIRYKKAPPSLPAPTFSLTIPYLRWLLNRLLGSPQKQLKRRDKLNQQIRSNLRGLNPHGFHRLRTLVLPELQAVGHSDADNWAASQPVRTFLGNKDTVRLGKQVGEVFDRWEAEQQQAVIPLDPLGEKLQELLQALAPSER